MQRNKLVTMFMNPSWWVRSYEVAASVKASHLSPLELSCDSGLTPALNPVELSALSIVLSNIQSQLLSGQTKVILDPVQHRKFVSSTSRSKIFSFERTLQILTGIRLLSGNRSGGFDVTSLFKGESWQRQGYYNGLVIELELAELGAELIFGMAEPYSELERLVGKKHRVQRHLGGEGPLGLWQSIWLDLQGLEQILVLRLEKSMQWDNLWLRLDGVFGQSFSELFSGLEIPKPRGRSSQWSQYQIMQRVLERLGRKLLEHGLLSFELDDEFLALGDESQDLSLIWQAGPEYLSQLNSTVYQRAVANYFRQHVFSKNLDGVVKVLAGGLYGAELRDKLFSLWEDISGWAGEDDCLGVMNKNMPLLCSSLFFEFYIRQLSGHSYPIPETQHFDLLELANPLDARPLDERFSMFKMEAKESAGLLKDVESIAGLSLASSRTQSDSDSYAYFAEVQKLVKLQKKPVAIDYSQAKVEVKKEAKPEVTKASSSFANRIQKPTIGMKKVAAEKLAKLRSSQPQRYQELKSAYIETLDAEKRKIIVEVMERLQPHTFDDHLKNSLIKFMLENPSAWLGDSSSQLS